MCPPPGRGALCALCVHGTRTARAALAGEHTTVQAAYLDRVGVCY